jgi:microcystin degradation protein MlrC
LTNGNGELAEKYANYISNRFWESREQFLPKMPSVSEAVEVAIKSRVHPVILADTGDNIGAGTPGDSTFILSELLEQEAEGAVVIIADAESAKVAASAGVGETVGLLIGGKTDGFHGAPIHVSCRVDFVCDGVFRNVGPMRDGIIENMGTTAVVSSGGIKIVLTEIKMPPWNLEQLRSVGIDPTKEKIIALKSAVAFRAAYEPIAGMIIEVNSPGLSAADLGQFQFINIDRPVFPFDEMEIETD